MITNQFSGDAVGGISAFELILILAGRKVLKWFILKTVDRNLTIIDTGRGNHSLLSENPEF